MKLGRATNLVIVVLTVVTACCASQQQTVAYRTVGTLIVGVDTAMQAYAQLVGAGKISHDDQLKVTAAYEKYYDAAQAVRALVAAGSGETPPPEAMAAAGGALLDLLRALGVKTS